MSILDIGKGLFLNRPRARVVSTTVPLQTGILTTVSTFGLLAPVTFARLGSSNANLTMNAAGQISATAALTAGQTQTLYGTATGADGVVFPFTANLTGVLSLGTLTLSALTAATGNAWSATINGKTAGSTITASSSDGTTLTVSGTTVSGTFSAAGSPTITLTETIGGASNSPRVSTATVTVSLSPTLGALSLSATTFVVGTASSGTINGATAGSTITVSGAPAGFSINSAARTWSYNGSGSATSGSLTLTETLAGATNTPRSTVINFTVSASGSARFDSTTVSFDSSIITFDRAA